MQHPSLGCLASLLAVSLPGVRAWVSTSQARYGASIELIQDESLGLDAITPAGVHQQQQMSLGYLWSLPADSSDDRGLGGSITWAFDEKICDDILPLFNEKFWGISFVNCQTIKASIHRAFETWAMNSKHIKFTDVSSICKKTGQLRESCTHAEVWVTVLNKSKTTTLTEYQEAASARQTWPLSYQTDFRSTNGQTPYRQFGTYQTPRPVAEIQRGVVAFQSQNICWYLDSMFCANWHAFKKLAGDNNPNAMKVVSHQPAVTQPVHLPFMKQAS